MIKILNGGVLRSCHQFCLKCRSNPKNGDQSKGKSLNFAKGFTFDVPPEWECHDALPWWSPFPGHFSHINVKLKLQNENKMKIISYLQHYLELFDWKLFHCCRVHFRSTSRALTQLAQSPSITIIKFNSKCFIANLLFSVHRHSIHDSSERKLCVYIFSRCSWCRHASLLPNSFSIYFNRKKRHKARGDRSLTEEN